MHSSRAVRGLSGAAVSSPEKVSEALAGKIMDCAAKPFREQDCRQARLREIQALGGVHTSESYYSLPMKKQPLPVSPCLYEEMFDQELLRPLEQAQQGLIVLEAFFAKLGQWISYQRRPGDMLINLMAEDGGQRGAVGPHSYD